MDRCEEEWCKGIRAFELGWGWDFLGLGLGSLSSIKAVEKVFGFGGKDFDVKNSGLDEWR